MALEIVADRASGHASRGGDRQDIGGKWGKDCGRYEGNKPQIGDGDGEKALEKF